MSSLLARSGNGKLMAAKSSRLRQTRDMGIAKGSVPWSFVVLAEEGWKGWGGCIALVHLIT